MWWGMFCRLLTTNGWFSLSPVNPHLSTFPPMKFLSMKQAFKWMGLALGSILLLAGLLAAFVAFSPLPAYPDVPLREVSIEATPELVEHGQKLVMMSCAGCHMPEHSQQLIGMLHPDADSRAMGMVHNANLTQHREHGIGLYNEAELYRLLRTGVKRDGRLSLPIMPRMPHSAERDVEAIIAFLKSDHPAVQAHPTQHPPYQPTFLARMLATLAWKPLPYPSEPVPEPSPQRVVDYGRYLLQHRYGCFVCHSGDITRVNHQQPELTPNYLGGGHVFNMAYPEEAYAIAAPSLLADGNTAQWTEAQFISALLWGQRPSGMPYQRPMHPYTMMDSSEARAIWQYLQTVE